jgi:DNA-binding transcriptional MerR regulator
MGLGELTDAADVSVRTVRYYIAEGLLPPPEGAGPTSAYTTGHLDRLRLIQRLKEAYLPLKEIRRRLAGLDDTEVREILAAGEEPLVEASWLEPAGDRSLAAARDYLALMETRGRYRTEPMALPTPAALEPEPPVQPGASSPAPATRLLSRVPAERVAPQGFAAQEEALLPEEHVQGLWRRIPLGDEAELVISDRAYGRHRDRIDWLVRWARKVFD